MNVIPALPFRKLGLTRANAIRRRRSHPRPPWSSEGLHRIEVEAPDSECAAALLAHASPLFPAELASGSGFVVRLQPPADSGWVIELLSLVDRWLESSRLPSANVLYGGRSYLIRAPLDVAQIASAASPTRSGR